MTGEVAVQKQRPIARREPREKPIVQKGGFYQAGNKKVPDAKRTQEEANKRNIPIEIIQTEQTEEYAEAIVRAWLPDHTQYTDDVVHHQFSVIRELKSLEYLEKQVSGDNIYFRGSPIQMFEDLSQPFNKNGDPILTGVGYLKLLTEMARFKNFALRDAVTKASRRAQLKLLNREWRDKDEIKSEKDEEKMVQDSIKNEQAERVKRPAPGTKKTLSKKRSTTRRTTRSKPEREEYKSEMPPAEKVRNPEPDEPDNVQEGQLTGESYWKQLAETNSTLHIVIATLTKNGTKINKKNILETSADLIGEGVIDAESRRSLLTFLQDKNEPD